MTEFIVRDTDSGNEREFSSRSEAEDAKSDLESLGATVEIEQADGGSVEVVEEDAESPTPEPEPAETQATDVEELPEKTVGDDPIDWVPSHFVDEIQGVPAINRKGYAVLAEQYGIEVTREFVTYPSETEFEFAEAEATAVTEDGKEYSGFGSASVARGDDAELLGELAETRAMKRATAWATGVGMTAVSELKNEL